MATDTKILADLMTRADGKCELCGANDSLDIYHVPESPVETAGTADEHVLSCQICQTAINSGKPDPAHWTCLTDSMWSQVPAVQVIAWRLLQRHKSESWANEALDMLYLDEEVASWAESGLETSDDQDDLDLKHLDSNGSQLSSGDTVVLIKDLNVKGAGFTAKRGTAVRNISVSPTNASHIEGRVNGQQIVILTEFVKKS